LWLLELNYYGLGRTPSKEELLPENHNKVRWLEYGPVEKTHFCDFVHLNETGRRQFESWLGRALH
jgi:hypothetical protein